MAERTFQQVIPVYGVLKDLPLFGLSFESIVLDNLAYAMGSFDFYLDNLDYATWFAESSMGPIIGDVLVSGGRVMGGIIRAQVASGAEWKARAKAL